MKQVIAIIREERLPETLDALARPGITILCVLPVLGRGRQGGTLAVPGRDLSLGRNAGEHLRRPGRAGAGSGAGPLRAGKPAAPGFLPKQMLIYVASEGDVESSIRSILEINQQGRHGDGKIFICPVGSSLPPGPGNAGCPAAG
jgi:nitrogen regulatory protein PII 2